MAEEKTAPKIVTPVSRRTLIKAAGGTAIAAAAGGAFLARPHYVTAESIETIAADLSQVGTDFSRGQLPKGEVGVAASSDGLSVAASSTVSEFLSPHLKVDFPMTHVGAHWEVQSGGGTYAIDTRYSPDGSRWTDWFPVQVEVQSGAAPRAGVFGALQLAYGATIAQYRIRFDTRGGPVTVRRVTLTCINVNDGARAKVLTPADGGNVSAADLYRPKPTIVTRAQWGCYEGHRYSGGQLIWPPEYFRWKVVVPHHTATPNGYYNSAEQVRSIYYYHAVTQGWGDIGYHALVGNDKRTYEGRKGRENEVLSMDLMGGHAGQCNAGSFGFAFIGDFQWNYIPSGMQTAGANLASWVCAERNIDPLGQVDFMRSDRTYYRGPAIAAHRHIVRPDGPYATTCPGDAGYSQFGGFRSRVQQRIDAAPTKTPTGDPTPTPVVTSRGYKIVRSERSANSESSLTAYDNQTSTYWQTKADLTSPPTSSRILFDIGSVKYVGKVRWLFIKAGMADHCIIERSNDKSTWTFVADASGPTARMWEERLVNQSLRYIRFNFRNPNKDKILGGLSEVQIWP